MEFRIQRRGKQRNFLSKGSRQMNPITVNTITLGTHRFVRGTLQRTSEGTIILNTGSGSIPVSIEGAMLPLDQEEIFQLIREEPGLLLLAPYRRESLTEALPFLKELLIANEEEAMDLLQAAVSEELPLTREVFSSLKKWGLTAEKLWGVKVDPKVFAFLLAKKLPITPKSIIWAVYSLSPSAQKEIWKMAFRGLDISQLFKDRGEKMIQHNEFGKKVSTDELSKQIITLLEQLNSKKSAINVKQSKEEEILKEAAKFLESEASKDPFFPQVVLYLCTEEKNQVRWEGKGFKAENDSRTDSFSFRLIYQSSVLGDLQVSGVSSSSELNLIVSVEDKSNYCYFTELKSYLQNRGWQVKGISFQDLQKEDRKEKPVPLRVDGWL